MEVGGQKLEGIYICDLAPQDIISILLKLVSCLAAMCSDRDLVEICSKPTQAQREFVLQLSTA